MQKELRGRAELIIPGFPQADSHKLMELIRFDHHVQKVMLYGFQALGDSELDLTSIYA